MQESILSNPAYYPARLYNKRAGNYEREDIMELKSIKYYQNTSISKHELARLLYPGKTFDSTLPQEWLNHIAKTTGESLGLTYHEILFSLVWIYDSDSPCFGRPAPLTIEAYNLLNVYYNCPPA